MAEPTKEELSLRVKALETLLGEKEELIVQQQQALQKLSAKGEGWLITAPNPLFDGQVYGIQFVNGQAFIRKAQRVAHFEHEPLKETTIEKLRYTPAEVEAIRKREQRTSAELAAEALKAQFGYQVEYFGVDQLGVLQTRIDQRLNQRMQAEEFQAAQLEAEKVITPHYLS